MNAVALCLMLLANAALAARVDADPAATFIRKCSSCHSFGKGVLIGPDLAGVTGRHDRHWLAAWIASSATLIQAGDPAAIALFAKYKQQRMPDQNFSATELTALIDYLAAGGPEKDARASSRRADTATREEIDRGRSLFMGRQPLTRGGASCSACHRVREDAGAGGSLGPDLTRAYARFQDKGLASLLGRGCFPRGTNLAGRASLTDQESFALRAFLYQAETGRPPTVASTR